MAGHIRIVGPIPGPKSLALMQRRKKAVMDGGGEAIRFSAAENARVRKIGAEVSEAKIKEYEAKGMPARAIYSRMRELSERHAKTSKNFWN